MRRCQEATNTTPFGSANAAPTASRWCPRTAHVSLASPERNHGIQILRRGYNYADGIDPATGQIDAGLFFLAYQKNAHEQFVPIQRRLGANDLLNEYIKHVSSGLYACPGGVARSATGSAAGSSARSRPGQWAERAA